MTASTITSPRTGPPTRSARATAGWDPTWTPTATAAPSAPSRPARSTRCPTTRTGIVGCSSHGNYWRGERLPRSSHPRVTVQRGGWSDNVYLDHVLAGVVHCPGGAERSYRAEALDGTTARFATRTAAENWFADR